MSLFVDGIEPSKIFSGDAAVAAVFVGAEKVWPEESARTLVLTDLGSPAQGGMVGGVAFEDCTGQLRLWAADYISGEIKVIDIATGATVSSFSCLTKSAATADATVTGGTSLDLNFDSATSTIYCCDFDGYRLHTINAETLTYTSAVDFPCRPRSSVTSPDGQNLYLYLEAYNDGEDPYVGRVIVMSTTPGPPTLVKEIFLSARGSYGFIELASDGGRAYVVNASAGVVDEIDLAQGTVLNSFGGNGAYGLAIARSGGVERLFVSSMGAVEIYDTADNSLIRTVTGLEVIGGSQLSASPDNRRVYVTGENLTYQLDSETGEILDSDGDDAHKLYYQVAVSPDSRLIAVGNFVYPDGGVYVFEANYADLGTPAP